MTVRLASIFYALVTLGSLLVAWLFGHLDTLLGERVAAGDALWRGAFTGLGIVIVTHAFYHLFHFAREASRMMSGILGPLTAAQAIYLAALSGFAEELCFRGALWPHLGLAGTSILFGIVHTIPARQLALYPVFAALAGLVFGTLRQSSGSIWPPAVAHATVNAINLMFLARMRGTAPAPPIAPPGSPTRDDTPAPEVPLHFPEGIQVQESYPMTIWRYDLRVELQGTDRVTLQECLEHESLALFQVVNRDEVYRQLSEGLFVFAQAFPAPFAAFPGDLETLSTYLFQPVIGIEVAERYADSDHTDDVRAWKIVAQRGEWVKTPLIVDDPGDGTFRIDPDNDDEEVLAAHWDEYPRWFQDGMRFKYPRLRDL